MKAEQQTYGQTVGYREKHRGRKHPYLSARRQRRNAANHTSTMGENWKWRMSKDDLTSSLANKLLDITNKSGRCVNG